MHLISQDSFVAKKIIERRCDMLSNSDREEVRKMTGHYF